VAALSDPEKNIHCHTLKKKRQNNIRNASNKAILSGISKADVFVK
jgi:hypothetical protein